jgi:hypothetical protein
LAGRALDAATGTQVTGTVVALVAHRRAVDRAKDARVRGEIAAARRRAGVGSALAFIVALTSNLRRVGHVLRVGDALRRVDLDAAVGVALEIGAARLTRRTIAA